MLKIRLRRIGKRNQPCFAIVVAEHKRAAKGKFIEKIGSYNPIKKTFSIKIEKVNEWREKGANLSDTVHNLLVKNKIIKDKPIKKTVKKKIKKEIAGKISERKKETLSVKPKEEKKEKSFQNNS